MGTSWKSQQDFVNKIFSLQFETNDEEKYKKMEHLCYELMDAEKKEQELKSIAFSADLFTCMSDNGGKE